MTLTEELKAAILEHAQSVFPNECCGVIVSGKYYPCKNISETPLSAFKINPIDADRAEENGVLEAYVHSHPDSTAHPSEYDRFRLEKFKKPWVICSLPEIDFSVTEPCGYVPPLVGRNFHHGWQDCFTLIRDFYIREFGIEIPDFHREDLWWENSEGESLYIENYSKAGFKPVDVPQYGDVILFCIRSTHSNHAAIYLEDNNQFISEESARCIGSPMILHHMYDYLSKRDIYSRFWIERSTLILRHESKFNA